MASVNKVILIGRLGQDPETRTTADGRNIVSFSLATSRFYNSPATGQRVEETEWHRITFFGKTGEICQQYLRKGSQIYVEGRLRTNKWEKDGQVHYSTGIVGERMQMLDRKNSGMDEASDFASAPPSYAAPGFDNTRRPAPAAPARTPQFDNSSSRPAAPAYSPNPINSGFDDEDIPF